MKMIYGEVFLKEGKKWKTETNERVRGRKSVKRGRKGGKGEEKRGKKGRRRGKRGRIRGKSRTKRVKRGTKWEEVVKEGKK